MMSVEHVVPIGWPQPLETDPGQATVVAKSCSSANVVFDVFDLAAPTF